MVNNFDDEKMFTVKCSQEDFEQLQELFESGQLNESLGVEVIDMGITSTETSIQSVILSQWLQGKVEPNWQVIEKLSNIENQLSKHFKYVYISCKKNYDLKNNIDDNYIELIVKIELTQSQGEIDINVIVKPGNNKSFLSPDLTLLLLADSDILAKVQTGSEDNMIQHRLTGDIGDNFSVKIVFGDTNLQENFVI